MQVGRSIDYDSVSAAKRHRLLKSPASRITYAVIGFLK